MTRYDILLQAYHNYDVIYTAMLLIAAWASGTGHLLDWILHGKAWFAIYLYWAFVLALYVISVALIGLRF